MKFNYNLNLPQKSILGFKVLSSFHSSIACYLLLITGIFLNPFFGSSLNQTIAGSLFNVVLNLSLLILVINLFIKRKQLNRVFFVFLNSFLFLYTPLSLYIIGKNIQILFFFISRIKF